MSGKGSGGRDQDGGRGRKEWGRTDGDEEGDEIVQQGGGGKRGGVGGRSQPVGEIGEVVRRRDHNLFIMNRFS